MEPDPIEHDLLLDADAQAGAGCAARELLDAVTGSTDIAMANVVG
ncbi:hypothetical protein [Montanilutibacter psychrotolerans]|nr:hypothetical protein [Lysobacter psychrotolerans]